MWIRFVDTWYITISVDPFVIHKLLKADLPLLLPLFFLIVCHNSFGRDRESNFQAKIGMPGEYNTIQYNTIHSLAAIIDDCKYLYEASIPQ